MFVIATCNDISKLPPEFARAERFDGIFFLDVPDAAQKGAIWDVWLRAFELDPLTEAANNVVPVAVTAAESVTRLREWAGGRCLDADRPGIHQSRTAGKKRSRRSIPRDPSVN